MGDVQSWPGGGGGWPPRQPVQPATFGPPAPAYGSPAPAYGSPPAPAPAYAAPAPYASPQAAMRAAHTDRERTIDVLKAAYAEGRLSAAEYGERFEGVNSAQTYGQLAQLVADLPAGPGLGPPVAVAPVPATFMPPMPPPVRPVPNNSMAIASLVMGLLCVPTMGMLGLPAVITGHVARSQISRTKEAGDGMATAGLVLGYLSVAGWGMMILFGMLMVASHG